MVERNTNEAYLLIGGNIGDRMNYLFKAQEAINTCCGTISKTSAVYETAAWGYEEQGKFLNQVLVIETKFSAEGLLKEILKVEEEMGRKRDVKYGPRTIDIDILLFNDDVIKADHLTIPHPEMQNRRFVLVPLCEIAPGKIHPVFKKTVAQLLTECPDKLDVYKFN